MTLKQRNARRDPRQENRFTTFDRHTIKHGSKHTPLTGLLIGAGLLCLALLSGFKVAAQTRPSLYVYLHTSTKPLALQRLLSNELKEVEVTAFGRFRDFKKALQNSQPDAVLALSPVLEAQNLTPSLTGLRGGEHSEPYVLLSNETRLDKQKIEGKTLGVVDLLGRKQMTAFVTDLLSTGPSIKIKRVTKSEDLLPLLQFDLADALLLPQNEAQQMMALSALDLKLAPIDVRVGLAAAACLTGTGEQICRSIEGFELKINQTLGVDTWRREILP